MLEPQSAAAAPAGSAPAIAATTAVPVEKKRLNRMSMLPQLTAAALTAKYPRMKKRQSQLNRPMGEALKRSAQETEQKLDTMTASFFKLSTVSSFFASASKTVASTSLTTLKSGWLSKRGEGQAWRKRWVVLTNESLMYFRNPSDKQPRDSLSFKYQNDIQIERAPNMPTALNIHLTHSSVQKKRSRVSLMADTERELQEWLNLLKAVAGVPSQPLRSGASLAVPLYTVNPAVRSAFFNQKNASGATPLHALAEASAAVSGVEATVEHLSAAAWLVGGGADVSARDVMDRTALQIVARSATFPASVGIARLLAKKGTAWGETSHSIYSTF